MEFRCLVLCEPEHEILFRHSVERFARREGRSPAVECFARREELLYRLRRGNCDAVVVALPGALGMESAIGVRGLDARVPLVWVSDDEGFGMQSYRLRTRMFLRFPVEEEQMAQALERCV